MHSCNQQKVSPHLEDSLSPHAIEESFKGDSLYILDFYTDWCKPCKLMEPDLRRAINEYKNKVVLVRINGDEREDLVVKYQIQGYPTLLYIKKGAIIYSSLGAQSYNQIKTAIEKYAH